MKNKTGLTLKYKKSRGGFTLVELAVVLAIVGIVIGGLSAMVRPAIIRYQINVTHEKLDNIAKHLAVYVQRNGKLPCPADPDGGGAEPFGCQHGSNAACDIVDLSCAYNGNEGIVPFIDIGISDHDARDGWGNYITYEITPSFGRGITEASYQNVHTACRTPHWYNGTEHLNPAKAKFCCIRDVPSGGMNTLGVTDGEGGDYGNPWNVAGSFNSVNIKGEYKDAGGYHGVMAYVLISHGFNGQGAFLANGTNDRLSGGIIGDDEALNADITSNMYVMREMNMSQTSDHFDDILLWRTNDQIISEFGNDSCAGP